MSSIIIPFIALYLAVFLLMAGVGLLGTYLPLRLTVDGISTQSIGYITSLYFFGMCVGALYCYRLIKSVGHIRSFAAFAALTTAFVMLHGLFSSPVIWGILRFFAGLSTIGLYTVIESWLNECSAPTSRGRVMSVYMIVCYFGMSSGQFFLNIGKVQNSEIFMIISLLLVLCIVPVVVTRSLHPELPEFGRPDVFHMVRKAPVGTLGSFLAGLLNGAFYAIVPVFCHKIGLPATSLATVMSATILGGLVLQWPVGALSDRFDRVYILGFICLAVALTGALVVFATKQEFIFFLLSMIMFGGFIFTVYPVSVARAHDLFEAADIVPASSFLLLCYCLGATAGPILASTTMMALGTAYGFFVYCSFVSLFSAIVIFYLRRKEFITIVPAQESSTFVVMKGTSPASILLDPRADMYDDQGPGDRQHPPEQEL
ncbi:MFS transporter [Desulfoprunum benzoelyticum]|uniref:MFS family permease n=1 Tax=Desulfoprunum benzoelyticum TaxID=1506996 RepID=A0A840UM70_9BACT|nr:MFS transporter [Desulfoprunum benzoelyticum]MBB5346705.1 MFS family permease [Desulfoprunum benzoelyticum]MBM9529052.1 MFS transporter [Desulfoprunum benzoelyticum]